MPPSETDPDDVVRYNPQQTTQPHAHLAVKPVSVCRTISRDNTADRAARDDDRLAFLGRKMRDLTVHGQPHHGPTISATPEKDGDEIMPDGRNMFIYPSVNSYDTVAHQPRLHGGWTTPPSLPPGKVPNILSRRYLEDGPWVPYHYVKETNATSVEKTSDSADIVGTDMDNNDLPAKGFLRNTSRKPRTRSRTSTLPRLHSRVPSSAVTEEGPPSRREAARRRNLRQHPSPDVAKRQLTVPGNDFSTDSVQVSVPPTRPPRPLLTPTCRWMAIIQPFCVRIPCCSGPSHETTSPAGPEPRCETLYQALTPSLSMPCVLKTRWTQGRVICLGLVPRRRTRHLIAGPKPTSGPCTASKAGTWRSAIFMAHPE